jgi:hypothetical protein
VRKVLHRAFVAQKSEKSRLSTSFQLKDICAYVVSPDRRPRSDKFYDMPIQSLCIQIGMRESSAEDEPDRIAIIDASSADYSDYAE